MFDPTTDTDRCNFYFYAHLTDQIESGGLYVYYRTENNGPLYLLWERSDHTTNGFTRFGLFDANFFLFYEVFITVFLIL